LTEDGWLGRRMTGHAAWMRGMAAACPRLTRHRQRGTHHVGFSDAGARRSQDNVCVRPSRPGESSGRHL